MSERLGKWSFWITFVGFNVAFFPMHISGIKGMPRRIYTYPPGLGVDGLNMTSTIGAFILGVGIAISLFNFWKSMRSGAFAGKNPWNADTLEWSSESPPPAYGYVHTPRVRSRHPLWDDYDEEYDPGDQRVYDRGRLSLASTWLDAEPVALSRMPEDTLTPLYLTLAMSLLFAALLAGMLWLSLAAVVANIAVMAFWLWPRQERIAA